MVLRIRKNKHGYMGETYSFYSKGERYVLGTNICRTMKQVLVLYFFQYKILLLKQTDLDSFILEAMYIINECFIMGGL